MGKKKQKKKVGFSCILILCNVAANLSVSLQKTFYCDVIVEGM